MGKPGEGDGGDGGQEPPGQAPETPPADDFKAKFEAEKTAREAIEKKLAEANKGRMTDAERIAALEADHSKLTQTYETLNANFGALKSTYDAEQNEKKTLEEQERADLVAKLKAVRPGFNDANLSKCDMLFLRDLVKNTVPPEPSAKDVKEEAFKTERDKRIAELREQRKSKNKR